MGQPIVVVEKPSVANPGMVRFETNRSISGMGHERYVAGTEVRGDRPPDELARRLLVHESVASVHINGSVVTVDLAKGRTSEGLKEVIESLYIHYPATEAVVDEDASPEVAAEATEASPGAPEDEGEVVEAEAAAPAESAPEPVHEEPVPAAEVAAEELAEAADEAATPPAAPSSDAVAEADEVTDDDVQQVEGDAPTTDQTPVDATPSEPPADDAAPAPAQDPETA